MISCGMSCSTGGRLLEIAMVLHRGLERQASGSEALQQQPSAYLGTPPPPNNVLERIPEDSATHDVALSPQDLFPGKFCLHASHTNSWPFLYQPLCQLSVTHLCHVGHGYTESYFRHIKSQALILLPYSADT